MSEPSGRTGVPARHRAAGSRQLSWSWASEALRWPVLRDAHVKRKEKLPANPPRLGSNSGDRGEEAKGKSQMPETQDRQTRRAIQSIAQSEGQSQALLATYVWFNSRLHLFRMALL